VHIESWQAAYRGLMPQDVLDNLSVDASAERWVRIITTGARSSRVLVAEHDGEISAWSSFGPARDVGAPATGELYAIYAHPDSWSSGIGHAILTAAEAELRDAGHLAAYLWVLEGNDRAVRFYERHEWAGDGALKVDERPGNVLREHRHVKTFAPE